MLKPPRVGFFVILGFILLWSTVFFSGEVDAPLTLFEVVKSGSIDLSDEQREVLKTIERAPTTKGNVILIRLHSEVLKAKKITVEVPTGEPTPTVLKDCSVEHRRENVSVVTWTGNPEIGPEGAMDLWIQDDFANGMIHYDNKVYSVKPLGAGLIHIIFQLNQRGFQRPTSR